jgi:hypothetical protein
LPSSSAIRRVHDMGGAYRVRGIDRRGREAYFGQTRDSLFWLFKR